MSFNSKIATCFNSNYSSVLSGLLDNISGLSDSDKQAILNGVNSVELVKSSDINIDNKLNELKEDLEDEVVSKDLEADSKIKKKEESFTYDAQEAKEGFTISEVKIKSKVEVTDQPDYMYNPYKKQNILKVFIDKIKNILSINKESGQTDFIHNSGSYIRIDGKGNVTEYVTGNYKKVICGSYSEEVRGGKCVTIKKSNYEDVGGDDIRGIKGSRNATVKGGDTINGTLEVTKSLTAMDTITANSLIHSNEDVTAGSISLKYHKHITISPGSLNTIPKV